MSLAQGNNTPIRPRIELGSPDPESDALTTRPVRSPKGLFEVLNVHACYPTYCFVLLVCIYAHGLLAYCIKINPFIHEHVYSPRARANTPWVQTFEIARHSWSLCLIIVCFDLMYNTNYAFPPLRWSAANNWQISTSCFYLVE